MIVSHIVAIDEKRGIGKNNDIPWKISEDLKRFKELTLDKVVIMGKNTYLSIGKPLPQRYNIVVSTTLPDIIDGVRIVKTIHEALEVAFKLQKDVFIIGGEKIYKETITLTDFFYITEVEGDFDCEVKYPDIELKLLEETPLYISNSGIKYKYKKYTR